MSKEPSRNHIGHHLLWPGARPEASTGYNSDDDEEMRQHSLAALSLSARSIGLGLLHLPQEVADLRADLNDVVSVLLVCEVLLRVFHRFV